MEALFQMPEEGRIAAERLSLFSLFSGFRVDRQEMPATVEVKARLPFPSTK